MNFIVKKIYRTYVSFLRRFGSDDAYLRAQYFLKNGRELNLDPPLEFMEKIQWLKLNVYTEEYGRFVDKYEVRKHVADVVGEDVLIPIFGVYDSVDEIKLDELPQQFALKCTHASGTNLIVKDKSKLNWQAAKAKLRKWMKQNYYFKSRERVYKNIKPRIVAEKFLSELAEGVIDYKFYCFHGEPKYVLVKMTEGGRDKKAYLTMDWEKLVPEKPNAGFLDREVQKPENFDEMVDVARKLSAGFAFIRIDLYSISGKTLFGEMTFFPTGGIKRYFVERMNRELGDKLTLPTS